MNTLLSNLENPPRKIKEGILKSVLKKYGSGWGQFVMLFFLPILVILMLVISFIHNNFYAILFSLAFLILILTIIAKMFLSVKKDIYLYKYGVATEGIVRENKLRRYILYQFKDINDNIFEGKIWTPQKLMTEGLENGKKIIVFYKKDTPNINTCYEVSGIGRKKSFKAEYNSFSGG